MIIFYIILNRQRNKKKNKKTSHHSSSKEEQSHKNVQKQSKWSEKDSIDDKNMKQAYNSKKIDYKDTHKSEETGRYVVTYSYLSSLTYIILWTFINPD